jgi:GMP synthase (glutamine-hydrolysing)
VSEPAVAVVITGEPIDSARERRGGFDRLLIEAAGPGSQRFVTLDARAELPPLDGYAGVVVSGSAASVTERAPWILSTELRLAEAVRAGTPVLGVCFGHQLLGQALGGRVARNPRGREIGTVHLERVAEDPLFSGDEPFEVNMTHLDAVVELPAGAAVIGRTALDPHAAVRFGERAWGVQFHPEIDADVMAAYVDGRSAQIRAEGLDLAAIRAGIRDGEPGRAVLRRFLSGVAAGRFER